MGLTDNKVGDWTAARLQGFIAQTVSDPGALPMNKRIGQFVEKVRAMTLTTLDITEKGWIAWRRGGGGRVSAVKKVLTTDAGNAQGLDTTMYTTPDALSDNVFAVRQGDNPAVPAAERAHVRTVHYAAGTGRNRVEAMAMDDAGTTPTTVTLVDGEGRTDLSAGREAWQAPSFGTNWATVGGNDLHFRKDADGRVHIQGRAIRQNAVYAFGTVVFTLPVGYRPAGNTYHLTFVYQPSTGGTHLVTVVIFTNGQVQIYSGVYSDAGPTLGPVTGEISSQIMLENILFYTD